MKLGQRLGTGSGWWVYCLSAYDERLTSLALVHVRAVSEESGKFPKVQGGFWLVCTSRPMYMYFSSSILPS